MSCCVLHQLPLFSYSADLVRSLWSANLVSYPAVHLSYADLVVDNAVNPSTISIQIKSSKTDQTRKGLRHTYIGSTGDELCPVAALRSYLSLRGDQPGPLFQWKDRTPLSKTKFVEHVLLHSSSIRRPQFRIGAGVEDSTIKTLGRWQSLSYLLYVRLDSPRGFPIIYPSRMLYLSQLLDNLEFIVFIYSYISCSVLFFTYIYSHLRFCHPQARFNLTNLLSESQLYLCVGVMIGLIHLIQALFTHCSQIHYIGTKEKQTLAYLGDVIRGVHYVSCKWNKMPFLRM